MPRFNKEERQKFAILAYGTSLDLTYYESLHERTRENNDGVQYNETGTEEIDFSMNGAKVNHMLKE